ncbi:MAG TPA: hypothetical protein VG963_32125, partial [Polyangiaceae bacterium]|nr:hypothetical protein [Polyangiaceae bacterium]
SGYRSRAWLLSSAIGLIAAPSLAQTSSPPAAAWGQLPASLSLPASALPTVPNLQLTAPTWVTASMTKRNERTPALWPRYWLTATLPAEWQSFPEDEWRLRVDTADAESGPLSLSSAIETEPVSERPCYPNCSPGADWHSSLVLKYDAGDVGPLQQTGPMLELAGKPKAQGVQQRGLVKVGLSGAF